MRWLRFTDTRYCFCNFSEIFCGFGGKRVCPIPLHGPLYHLCLTHEVNAGSRLACFIVDGVGAPLAPCHRLARTSFPEHDVSGQFQPLHEKSPWQCEAVLGHCSSHSTVRTSP